MSVCKCVGSKSHSEEVPRIPVSPPVTESSINYQLECELSRLAIQLIMYAASSGSTSNRFWRDGRALRVKKWPMLVSHDLSQPFTRTPLRVQLTQFRRHRLFKTSTFWRRSPFLSPSPWDCPVGLVSVLVYFQQNLRVQRRNRRVRRSNPWYSVRPQSLPKSLRRSGLFQLVLLCLLQRLLLNYQRILIS